jgi:anti-sigma regulatory factor (Ser/Thr protein kinase)
MFGMAIATAIGYYLAILVLLPHFFKEGIIFRLPRLTFDKKIAGQMLLGGSANAIGQFGRLLLTFILNRLLMAVSGTAAVATNAVILSTGNLCLVPGSAISDTSQILAGILCGEEDRTGIVNMMKTGSRFCLLANGVGILLFQIAARPLVGMSFSNATDTLELTITGFRFFVLCMISYSVNGLYRCFCQGSGQFRTALLITVMDSPVFPLAAALLLEFTVGVPAVWLCYCIGEGLLMILIFLFFRKRNSDAKGVEAITPFPPDLGREIEATLEFSIVQKDMAQVVEMSRQTGIFCKENGADPRTAFLMALFVEEAAGNVIEHGFRDGKAHRIDMRILRKKNEWVLRLRDDCPLFNSEQYLEQFSNQDPIADIGLKLIRKTSKEMVYLNTLNLNNLIVKL